MLQLNEREWAEFDIRAVFPEIRRGKRLKTADHIDGNTPYVSSSAMNNGVDAFIGNDGHIRKYENCITLANSGSVGTAFYHCYEFIASDHVTALQSSKLNKYSYLFIATMVSRLQGKYSFNREINDLRINREKVLLPVDEEGQPDYDFMEQYIREREKQLIAQYIEHIGTVAYTRGITPLHEKDWRCFVLGDLFTLVSGKCSRANRLERTTKNGIPYLGATNNNNAVLDFVAPVKSMVQKGNCIAFICDGEGSMGYAIYKREDFIATVNITLGYAPFLNMYNAFFITTIADMVRGKYSYNYKRNDTRLRKELLLLPVDSDGQPDWQYMEQYAKMLMAKVKLQYLQTRQA